MISINFRRMHSQGFSMPKMCSQSGLPRPPSRAGSPIRHKRHSALAYENNLAYENHGAQHLFDSVMKVLTDMDIDINNCKSQSYDNASNMAGVYTGVQARLKEINPFADFVTCSAHSLHLVGSVSAECSREAISFFGVLQGVYNFLSASPQRWAQFIDNMNKKV